VDIQFDAARRGVPFFGKIKKIKAKILIDLL